MSQQFLNQLTNIEKGFIFTAKELFVRPEGVVRDYWKGITINYYHPFRFALIWIALNLLINFWIGFDDLMQEALQPAMIEEGTSEELIESADQKFDSWLNILVLLFIPLFSLMTLWLFKKHKKNFAEHLIMNAYVVGQNSLLGTISLLIFYVIPALLPIFLIFNFLIGVVYNTWVYYKTFAESVLQTLWKTILISIIGIVTFVLMVYLVSTILIAVTPSQ